MKNLIMLALVLSVGCSGVCLAQNEPPLEPIPLPAPVAKSEQSVQNEPTPLEGVEAAGYDEVVMPLDGPVFPENTPAVAEQPPQQSPLQVSPPNTAPQVEAYQQQPVYVAPSSGTAVTPSSAPVYRGPTAVQPAASSNVVRGPVVRGPVASGPVNNAAAVNRAGTYPGPMVVGPAARQAQPTRTYYAAPGRQPVVVEQTYYQPSYRSAAGRTYARVSYQQVPAVRSNGVVCRTNPYSGVTTVEVTRAAPATYVQVPARPAVPYAAYRVAYPGMPPVVAAYGPLDPGLYPPAYVPGQPVRNAIRSMGW